MTFSQLSTILSTIWSIHAANPLRIFDILRNRFSENFLYLIDNNFKMVSLMMITRHKQQLFVMLELIFLLLVSVIQNVKNSLKSLPMKTASGNLDDSQPLINSNKKWSR